MKNRDLFDRLSLGTAFRGHVHLKSNASSIARLACDMLRARPLRTEHPSPSRTHLRTTVFDEAKKTEPDLNFATLQRDEALVLDRRCHPGVPSPWGPHHPDGQLKITGGTNSSRRCRQDAANMSSSVAACGTASVVCDRLHCGLVQPSPWKSWCACVACSVSGLPASSPPKRSWPGCSAIARR